MEIQINSSFLAVLWSRIRICMEHRQIGKLVPELRIEVKCRELWRLIIKTWRLAIGP
jgi:hypothetical protein